MKSTQKSVSSFWYDDVDFTSDRFHTPTETSDTAKLHKLASAKRAISNFVSIVVPTQPVKVRFEVGNSYTDGSTVTIGSNIDSPKEFDPAVGLALHEAAHIKLSDFTLLRDLKFRAGEIIGQTTFIRLLERAKGVGMDLGDLKTLLNYVEDRRIDQYIYDTAPGYRGYYKALYDKYFNDPVITKALASDEYTEETLESYMFRFINIHSDGSRLNALRGLPQIWKLVNLNDINRLGDTYAALTVALDIFEVITDHLEVALAEAEAQKTNESNETKDENEAGEGSADEGETSNGNGMEMDLPSEGSKDEEGDGGTHTRDGQNDGKTSSQSNSTPNPVQLTDRQKDQMAKKIQKQTDFVNGDVTKKKLTKKDEEQVQLIEESDSEMIEVGEGQSWQKVNCVFVKRVSQQLAESQLFPFYSTIYARSMGVPDAVAKGIRMGSRLAGKLQLRSDERTTEYNRLRSGKIDRRMLSGLGAGQTNVFFTKEVDRYNNANLHITLDGSCSMNGGKWVNAITATVAILKAVDEIPNLEVQVSIRGTNDHSRKTLPYVAIVYDSRVDKFSKVRTMFPGLIPQGTTPEGLTFQAIMKYIVSSTSNMDSYFLNMSDGQPYFPQGSYEGRYAVEHTRKQVDRILGMGVRVLSYFITTWEGADLGNFRRMYGQGATQISTDSITQIARTMNELFLSKK
jgi:hypothetical protein